MDVHGPFQASCVPLLEDLPPSSHCFSIVFHTPTIHTFAPSDLSFSLTVPLPLLCRLAPTGLWSSHWLPNALTRSPGALAAALTSGSQAPFLRSFLSLIRLPVCLLPGTLAPALTSGSQAPFSVPYHPSFCSLSASFRTSILTFTSQVPSRLHWRSHPSSLPILHSDAHGLRSFCHRSWSSVVLSAVWLPYSFWLCVRVVC